VWVGCPTWYCTNGQSESGSPIPNQETARKWGWMLTNQKRSSGCDQYFSVSSTSRFGTDTAYPLQYRYSTVQYVTNYSTVLYLVQYSLSFEPPKSFWMGESFVNGGVDMNFQ
jgi:hypothetical protein